MREFPNPDNLLTQVNESLKKYKEEDLEYEDAQIKDVLIVGSVSKEEYVPYQSDLDIIVILKNSPHKPICLGYDCFLMENTQIQQNLLQAANIPVNKVDVGVYSEENYDKYIDDKIVFSCKEKNHINLNNKNYL